MDLLAGARYPLPDKFRKRVEDVTSELRLSPDYNEIMAIVDQTKTLSSEE